LREFNIFSNICNRGAGAGTKAGTAKIQNTKIDTLETATYSVSSYFKYQVFEINVLSLKDYKVKLIKI
jgi:hypothetical protein